MFDYANDTKIKKKRPEFLFFPFIYCFFLKRRTIFNKLKMPKSARKSKIREFYFLRANKNLEFAFSRESATNGHTSPKRTNLDPQREGKNERLHLFYRFFPSERLLPAPSVHFYISYFIRGIE